MFRFSSWFQRPTPPLLGLHIGSVSVQLVALARDPQGAWSLLHCASAALEPGSMSDGLIARMESVVRTVQALLAGTQTTAHRLALALPAASVMHKKISVPAGMHVDELYAHVEAEASHYLPLPWDGVYADFHVLAPAQAHAAKDEVLLVAAHKEKVQSLQRLAQHLSLSLEVVEVASNAALYALARCEAVNGNALQAQPLALVEVAPQQLHMAIVEHDEIVAEHVLPFVTQAHHAELPGIPHVALPVIDVDASTSAMQDAAAQTLQQALRVAVSRQSLGQIRGIVLHGSTTDPTAFAATIAHATHIPTRWAEPFLGMATPFMSSALPMVQMEADQTAHYLTACGLAMRRYH